MSPLAPSIDSRGTLPRDEALRRPVVVADIDAEQATRPFPERIVKYLSTSEDAPQRAEPGRALLEGLQQAIEIRAGRRSAFHLRTNEPILDAIDVNEAAIGRRTPGSTATS